MINIINNDIPLEQIPNIPFIIKDRHGNYFMIVQDERTSEFRYVNLKDGCIKRSNYESLEDMFADKENNGDIIVDCDLIIKSR